MRSVQLLAVLWVGCSNPPKENKPIQVMQFGVTINAATVTVYPDQRSASIAIWGPDSGLAHAELLDLSALPSVSLEPPPKSTEISETRIDDRRLLEYRFQGGRYFRMFENVGAHELACAASILGGVTGGRGDAERLRDYELAKTACLSMRPIEAERSAQR